MTIEYAIESDLTAEDFIDVLERSTLARCRPVHNVATIHAMLRGATVTVTARHQGKLIGISRAISDGAFCTYLSDLAVDQAFQRQGIGKELIDRTHVAAGLKTKLILLAAPQSQSYYPHIGMQPHPSCWVSDAAPTSVTQPIQANNEPENATQGVNAVGALPVAANGAAVRPSGTPDSVGKFFDAMASEYGAAIHRCFPRYSEMLWAMLEYLPPLTANPRILELGCGTGNLSVLLAERFPRSALTCVDLSRESLDVCKSRLGDDPRFTLSASDMRSLNYDQGTFDLVISTIAIHHLTSNEKQQLFKQCFGWLRPGGAFCFADQFAAALPALHERHMANWKKISTDAGASSQEWDMWMEHQALHDHHATLAQQSEWLAEAGFQQVDCPWRYLLWTLLQGCKAVS